MGCTYYENDPIKLPVPEVPNPTTTLEAEYVATHPNSISHPYWKKADYLPIAAQDLVTGQVPSTDGVFNVSGLFNGLDDFNLGKDPSISLKAAYDDDSLYVLITWKDTLFNASNPSLATSHLNPFVFNIF